MDRYAPALKGFWGGYVLTMARINSRVADVLPPRVGLLERSIAGVASDENFSGIFCWIGFAQNYLHTVSRPPPDLKKTRLQLAVTLRETL